jgi:hypothetical protein
MLIYNCGVIITRKQPSLLGVSAAVVLAQVGVEGDPRAVLPRAPLQGTAFVLLEDLLVFLSVRVLQGCLGTSDQLRVPQDLHFYYESLGLLLDLTDGLPEVLVAI